jgi:hypothetical protein
MDVIAFEQVFARRDELACGWWGTEPIVNGVRLAELARAVELPIAIAAGEPRFAGKYAGLWGSFLWPSRHYLDEPREYCFGDGDTTLLGCTCSVAGCWPLSAIVSVDEHSVRWSGFRMGFRDWDLSALGPFVFDRDQYERALGRPESQVE